MPPRLRLLVPLLFLGLSRPGQAEEKIISGAFDLKALSAYLLTPGTDRDRSLVARIDNYSNPGQLKLGATSGRPDTLILRRSSPDSDAVINVDSVFIDAKDFGGTLILKNLAFRLKPKAALIAGFDLYRPNHNLILDSCFVYADTLDSDFLSWQGDTLAQLEIRNSWFVARSSNNGKARIYVAGGTVTLSNCLFNFPGSIAGSGISQRFEAYSNTANRVQFSLLGVPMQSGDPAYAFSQNLIAYHGTYNALGGESYYVLKASGFSEPRSIIQNNRMYKVWKGFDSPAGLKGAGTQLSDPGADGKLETELWNWYTSPADDTTGLLSGNPRRQRYNALPGTVRADTVIGDVAIGVSFRGAVFPRSFRWTLSPAPPLADSAYRMRAPLPAKLSFGPFQVDSIRLSSASVNGKPILLAQSPAGQFLPQPSSSRAGEAPSVFPNASPQARAFVLVDSGNTPRGFNVEPAISSLQKHEHLRFSRVDSAGQTQSVSDPNDAMPDSLRSLKRTFGFQTTASIDTTVRFATKPNLQPWSRPGDSSLFWYWKSAGLLVPASQGSPWGDSLVSGALRYRSTQGWFAAFLVEKLSIHAGNGFRKAIPGGASLLSNSAAGYQLYADTSTLDPERFGSATKGYAFTWKGRGNADNLTLLLKPAVADAQAYVIAADRDSAEPLRLTPDSAGIFNIDIGPSDSGKAFFAAVQFNVLANRNFKGSVDGVNVDSLLSSTSGRLAFRNLGRSDVKDLGKGRDTVFLNTRFLAGVAPVASGLSIAKEYNLAFRIDAKFSPANVEVWWLVNGTWARLPARANVGIDSVYARMPPGATHVVAVERFQAPESYAQANLAANPDSLIFHLGLPATPVPLAGYCLEVVWIDPAGQIERGGCDFKPPGDTVKLAINHDWAYAYRVRYFILTQSDTTSVVREYQYPPQFGWDSAKRLRGDSSLAKIPQGRWRILAAPLDAKLGRLLRHGVRAGDGEKVHDTTLVLNLVTEKGSNQARFDTAKVADSKMGPGTALLVASSHPLTLTLDSLSDVARTARPDTVAVKAGWNLIGNPYPISLRQACIKLGKPHAFRLVALNRDDRTGYSWLPLESALAPFTGYAYFAPEAETLYFDPGDTGSAAAAAKHAAYAPGSLDVSLAAAFGRSSMTLVRGEGEYPIRSLPALDAGLELRVGGDGGYWIKPVDDLARVDEPVEIRSPRAGVARFGLRAGRRSGTGQSAAPAAFALIDEATGTVYDAASAEALQVREGQSAYRLLAGDPAFVAARTRDFLSAAPSEIGLSQNYPNPARGLTRIALAWPATRERDRRAYLEVIDLRGRRVAWKRLDYIRVGRQVVDLDASAWKPGVYVYRLVVRAGGRTTRLQKRMVVAP